WLHHVMRTAPVKSLVIRGTAINTYGELVAVMSSATAAGVDQLFVSAGTDDPGVRVWLDAAAQQVPGVGLPVSDVASQVQSTAVPVVLGKTVGPAAVKTAVQRVAPGSIVRLRIDRSRKLSDVWEILKVGASRQLEGFA